MTDTEQTAFDLGVKAGLEAAMNLVADRAHCEHDRFEMAHSVFDDETAHDAIVRRDFASDIFQHLEDINNARYPKPPDVLIVSVPEFNPYSDLGFEIDAGLAFPLCEFCGDWDDVEFKPDPYDADIHDDKTPHWICGNCEMNHAGEI